MAQRVDWDLDDDEDFEILTEISSIKNQESFELIDNSFEILPLQNEPSSLINTNNNSNENTITTTVATSISEKPDLLPIKIEKPIVNEVKQSSYGENSSYLPIRYGSAALIPYDDDNTFDLKSIINRKQSLPVQTNDLLSLLKSDKTKKSYSTDKNDLQEILLNSDYDHQNLVQIARKAQQDFINAIQLD